MQSKEAPSLKGHYAGFTSRLLAYIIDTVIVSVTIVSTTWFVQVTSTTFRLGTFLGFSTEHLPWLDRVVAIATGPVVTGAVTSLFILGYYVFFWTFAGQTPGKAIVGLRVVTRDGYRVSIFRAVLRFFGYFLSLFSLFIGFLWVLVDDQRQALHDKVAGTVVIYTWSARPDERFLLDEINNVLRAGYPRSESEEKSTEIESQTADSS